MPDLRKAQLRHARYYLEVVRAAETLLAQGGERNSSSAIGTALDHLPNIDVAMQWARENSESDKCAAQICSDYPKAGALLFSHIYSPQRQLDDCKVAMLAAARAGDSRAESWHAGNLGNAYLNLCHLDEARDCYKHSLEICQRRGDRWTEARCLGNLGLVEAKRENYLDAITWFESALDLSRSLGDYRYMAQVLNNLAAASQSVGDARRAGQLRGASLRISRAYGYVGTEASVLNDLALAAADDGRWAEAWECASWSLRIARQLQDRDKEACALNSLGYILLNSESVSFGTEMYFHEALKINREMKNPEGEVITLLNLSVLAERTGNLNNEKMLKVEALTISSRFGIRLDQG